MAVFECEKLCRAAGAVGRDGGLVTRSVKMAFPRRSVGTRKRELMLQAG